MADFPRVMLFVLGFLSALALVKFGLIDPATL